MPSRHAMRRAASIWASAVASPGPCRSSSRASSMWVIASNGGLPTALHTANTERRCLSAASQRSSRAASMPRYSVWDGAPAELVGNGIQDVECLGVARQRRGLVPSDHRVPGLPVCLDGKPAHRCAGDKRPRGGRREPGTIQLRPQVVEGRCFEPPGPGANPTDMREVVVESCKAIGLDDQLASAPWIARIMLVADGVPNHTHRHARNRTARDRTQTSYLLAVVGQRAKVHAGSAFAQFRPKAKLSTGTVPPNITPSRTAAPYPTHVGSDRPPRVPRPPMGGPAAAVATVIAAPARPRRPARSSPGGPTG